MTDEIPRELWQIKDRIAEENDYSLDALVSYLRSKSENAPIRDGKMETPGGIAFEGKGASDRER
uniref:Uncharacterized protein n=1 Tax=Candidatus Kentrum eta TaxID=2126337 RepID=A0A450VDW7_9GAMM|nr:MAG: hypothetical protein BECKH772A_GA0070896_1011310 [Candidatus Kentron sp. H]VFJ97555.1 MAG: hypothetical protein BECKH772B_GA0070898_101149 [Candidatus Kentron sp. H]VFK03012.1 MAG: hypothetical protein BECKH772C_GA0070978_1011110 [Candidatus Kentron sp. H]